MAPTSKSLAHSIMGGASGLSGRGASGLTSGIIGIEPAASSTSATRYKGEFSSMTALAAACSTLGDIAYLIGATTGEIICLCRRAADG